MTLRVLSPSRRSHRAEKKQDDQENRLAQGSAENVPPSPGLRRSTNSKQASPKRRRLPLRDSILLTRKDSAEFSTGTISTDAATSAIRDFGDEQHAINSVKVENARSAEASNKGT
ncbi:hypothetical protein ColTof3_05532 [Colletotrichum tofieldiae]|nr:hypothetical protein ColTof3_05532 [Colletotrichum tofieldiae]